MNQSLRKGIFNKWINFTNENRERRLFNEIHEELESEQIFAQMNDFDPLEWCKGCQLGICESHMETRFFIPDGSYGIEN